MPDQMLPRQNARVLRDKMATGELTSRELVSACFARIKEREADVRAWVWYDEAAALKEATRLDAVQAAGGDLGPLHGLPIGIKDIIDTAGTPTRNGCVMDDQRIPQSDAALVTAVKRAGGIVLGKTVTTELAYLTPSKTRNPQNLEHTPGGSSSGSAAAVADGMVPLAVGTQTGGSVGRPASFCGVVGFKPSFGLISREGVLDQSHSLDTVGVFARDVDGAALLASVLSQPDQCAFPHAARKMRAVSPREDFQIGFAELPGWDSADTDMKEQMNKLCNALGKRVHRVQLPGLMSDAARQRAVINHAEMAHHFQRYFIGNRAALGTETRQGITDGNAISAPEYLQALDFQQDAKEAMKKVFSKHKIILCPAALGAAPHGLASTGDSIFNGLWTLIGAPAISLPLLRSSNGLPIGVQLVADFGQDAALMCAAQSLWDIFRPDGASPANTLQFKQKPT